MEKPLPRTDKQLREALLAYQKDTKFSDERAASTFGASKTFWLSMRQNPDHKFQTVTRNRIEPILDRIEASAREEAEPYAPPQWEFIEAVERLMQHLDQNAETLTPLEYGQLCRLAEGASKAAKVWKMVNGNTEP